MKMAFLENTNEIEKSGIETSCMNHFNIFQNNNAYKCVSHNDDHDTIMMLLFCDCDIAQILYIAQSAWVCKVNSML